MTSATTMVAIRAARATGTLVRQVRSAIDSSPERPAGAGRPSSGWLAVTVAREVSDLDAEALPAPLAELGDGIEVRLRSAAGDKGAELAARLRQRPGSAAEGSRLTGDDPESDLRSALRKAKQLLEVGEVLRVDPAPHGERPPTPGGALLESWTKAAPGAGVR